MRHYVDVTDADFERAATGGGMPDSKAAQKAAQSVRVRSGYESQAEGAAQEKNSAVTGGEMPFVRSWHWLARTVP